MNIALIVYSFLILHKAEGIAKAVRKDQRGPSFKTEPQARIEFSNSSGTELRCEADGLPVPKVSWQVRDGTKVTEVAGLRYQRGDGTLVFPPFERAEYRQDVHDTVYQCIASNEVGSILSKEIHVRGVIKQRFTPQVYDDFVVKGNTAVLRCHLPSFAREHVHVDAWIRSDDHVLKAESETRSRSYSVLRSGELLVNEVTERDSNWTFRCQTRHRLTGEMVVSASAGKIIVTEPHVSTLPRVTFSRSQVRAEEGTAAQLPCVAQGNPPPTYRWMKEVTGVLRSIKDLENGNLDGRLWMNQGTLNIRRIQFSDSGQYQCIVRNSIGERRIETSLVVTAPLAINLNPPHQVLSIGQEATFSCNVSGYPIHSVSWKRDTLPLVADTRVRLLSREVLHLSSVRRQDQGMYQCFTHNDRDSAQGTAELSIADAPPSIISAFPERTVDPGEKVSLKCVATGNPVPTITWHIDGANITSKSSRILSSAYVTEHGHAVGHLNISEALVEDGGEYRCQVTNEVGTTFHATRLNVMGPPFVRTMPNITAISGKDLVLSCPYGGYPIKGIRWFKGEMLLPLNHRQRVSHSGILTVQEVQRAADQGPYRCVVHGPDAGLSASEIANVAIVVSPVIDSRYFLETVTANEDSRIKLMCTVIEGDPPLRFHWLKNGQPFLAHGDTTVQTFDDSSIVTFRKISSTDRGYFTCVATNVAASANMTTQIIVNVSPQWKVKPQNATAILANTVWLDCSATGYPTPSILWKKLIYTENAAGDFTYVHSSPRAHRYNNGTLVLSDIEEGDAGSYLCQASNGIGAGLSKIIHLGVLIPPKFQDPYNSQTVTEDSEANLKCVAVGDPPIDIVWQKNKENIVTDQHDRYSIRKWFSKGETISEMLIATTKRQDSGMYSCFARSPIGSDEAVVQLTVQGPPDPPVNISVTNVTSRSLSLQWDIVHNGNSHITGSIIQYKKEPDSAWTGQTSQLIVSGAEKMATLRGLKPIITYFVRILAENINGRSGPSDVLNVTTAEEAPSSSPIDVQVHSTGAQSMKVLWKPPPEDTHNGYIRGYYIGYRQSSSGEPYHFKKVETALGIEQHSTYITGLKPFTRYDIAVKAFNSAGTGPKSVKVVGKTLESAPPTSPLVQIKSTTSSTIEIAWEKDIKDKSAITDYTLHYKTDDEDWKQQRLGTSQDQYTLEGLRCGTRYHLYMTASNSLGTGEPSVPVSVKTVGAAPMSPPASVFLVPNSTSVALKLSQWQDGGCTIEHFVVQYKPKQHLSQWTSTSDKLRAPLDQHVIRHLTPDREYVVLVTAYNDAGMTQGEYRFRTMPFAAQSSEPTSFPAFGKQETDVPFYKNVALVIPVVVSALVLVMVAFTVAVCFRKHSEDRRRRMDYESRKTGSDSLMMSEMCKVNNKSSAISSHYVIPSGTKPDYAEPYTCNNSTGQQGSDGLFATIKRHPGRPIYMSASYKDSSSSQQLPDCVAGSVVSVSSDKWVGQSNQSSHKSSR